MQRNGCINLLDLFGKIPFSWVRGTRFPGVRPSYLYNNFFFLKSSVYRFSGLCKRCSATSYTRGTRSPEVYEVSQVIFALRLRPSLHRPQVPLSQWFTQLVFPSPVVKIVLLGLCTVLLDRCPSPQVAACQGDAGKSVFAQHAYRPQGATFCHMQQFDAL